MFINEKLKSHVIKFNIGIFLNPSYEIRFVKHVVKVRMEYLEKKKNLHKQKAFKIYSLSLLISEFIVFQFL